MRDQMPIFPLAISPHVSTASATVEQLSSFKPLPQELSLLSSHACKTRRTQFLLGRMAAHAALSHLKMTEPQPILKGPRGQPLWPTGFIGSITHTNSIGLAAVAKQGDVLAIGIDIEVRDRNFNPQTAKHICTPEEEFWVFTNREETQSRLLSLFSAKESIYKAYFPMIRGSLGFKDVTLTWNQAHNQFSGHFLRQINFREEFLQLAAIPSFTIQCIAQQDYICTWFILPRAVPV